MLAAVLNAAHQPLRIAQLPDPEPGEHQVRMRVHACGVCRTDIHIIDGELSNPKLPLILGHQVVGKIEALGPQVDRFRVGDRVGVPWLGRTCGECRWCRSGRENLCERARFTGYTLDGGFAEHCVADARYCFSIPPTLDDAHSAPLLCAGLIGYRTLKLAGDAERVGIYGFGSAAHIVTQIAFHQGRKVFAFTRPGDTKTQEFARTLGAAWAGDSDRPPPEKLDAALIFAPAGELVPQALQALDRGGTVVCGGIHMSDIPSFPYEWLWEERSIKSVANLTRADGEEFFEIIARQPVKPEVREFELARANEALDALRAGTTGSVVLRA